MSCFSVDNATSLTSDRSSLSHGTPPSISSQNYDVPLPQMGSSSAGVTTDSLAQAVNSFPHLCWLTQLLGNILPMIYSLRVNSKDSWKTIRRMESALDDWHDALQDCLNASKRATDQPSTSSGASGLWLYFLSVKLVLNKLALKACVISSNVTTRADIATAGNKRDGRGPERIASLSFCFGAQVRNLSSRLCYIPSSRAIL